MYVHTKTTQMFLAALSIAKIWKNPNVHQQMDKQSMTCPQSGTLNSNRKKPTTDTYDKNEHRDTTPRETVRHRRLHVAWPRSHGKSRKGRFTQIVESRGWVRAWGWQREVWLVWGKEAPGSSGGYGMLTGCGYDIQLYVLVQLLSYVRLFATS